MAMLTKFRACTVPQDRLRRLSRMILETLRYNRIQAQWGKGILSAMRVALKEATTARSLALDATSRAIIPSPAVTQAILPARALFPLYHQVLAATYLRIFPLRALCWTRRRNYADALKTVPHNVRSESARSATLQNWNNGPRKPRRSGTTYSRRTKDYDPLSPPCKQQFRHSGARLSHFKTIASAKFRSAS